MHSLHSIVFVAAICAAASASALGPWVQQLPRITDFELYEAATDGATVVVRAGTDRSDAVYPLFASTPWPLDITSSTFAVSEARSLEYSLQDNTIGTSLAYDALRGRFAALVSLWPQAGMTVFVADAGAAELHWVELGAPPLIATDTAGSLVAHPTTGLLAVLPDDQAFFETSTDGGASWSSIASPLARGLGPEAIVYGAGFALFRYDLAATNDSSTYGLVLTSDFTTFSPIRMTNMPLGSSAAENTVYGLWLRADGLYVAALVDVHAGAVRFVASPTPGVLVSGAWSALAVVPLAGLCGGCAFNLRIAYCASANTAVLRFFNASSGALAARFVSSDGFASFQSSEDLAEQASIQSLVNPTDGSCVLCALGDYGYLATSDDGVAWAVAPNGPVIMQWSSLLYFEPEQLFVAVGDATLLLSADGIDWGLSPLPAVELVSCFVGSQLGVSLFCGSAGTVLFCTSSLQAATWEIAVSMPNGIVAAAFGNDVWVYADASGLDAHLYVATAANGTYSATYTAKGSALVSAPVFTALAFAGGQFWAFAQLEKAPKLVRSTDGRTWHDVLRPLAGCSYFGVLLPCGDRVYLQCQHENEVYVWQAGDKWQHVLSIGTNTTEACTQAAASYLGSSSTTPYVLTAGSNVFVSGDGVHFSPASSPAQRLNAINFPLMAADADTVVALGEFCDTASGSFVFTSQ